VNLLMTYAGDRDLTIEPVDLSKVTAEVLYLMRPPLNKTAVLDVNLGKNLPSVQANTAQIRQVVLNLITNAWEALKGKPGKITVSTGQVRLGKATATERKLDLPAGDYCYLEVSDTGCGMSVQTQSKVFDPFYTTKFMGERP
jgi:signal transduction histidine kinase